MGLLNKDEEIKNVDFLNEHAGKGFENINQDDLKIPFLRILQKLSPQVDEKDPNYIKGAQPGMFFNTVTQKLYGKEVNLIPIKYEKVWLEWKPNRGGFVARHEPYSIVVDQSNFAEWKYNGNIIQETLNFFVFIAGKLDEGPLVFSLSSTGIKHGKNWNTQIVHTRLPSGKQAPYFSSIWNISSIACTNAQGTWYQIGDTTSLIKRIRFISKEDFEKFINPTRKSLDKASSVDYKQLENQTNQNIEDVPY